MKKQYFENIRLIDNIERLVESIGRQDYVTVFSQISVIMPQLSGSLQTILEHAGYVRAAGVSVTENAIIEMLNGLLEAQENEDYILYGDLLKLQVLPFLLEIQNAIRSQEDFFYDEDLYKRNLQRLREKDHELYEQLLMADRLHEDSVYQDSIYSVEYTAIGAFTLALEDSKRRFYIHSNNNPLQEARQFAEAYFDVEQEHYLGFGLGLGYQWEALLKHNPDIRLSVCEPDIAILKLAFTYTDMSWYLEKNNVKIYYDPQFCAFQKSISNGADISVVVLRAYLKHIQETCVKELLENLLVRENSIRLYRDSFYINSRQNFKNCQGYVDELELRGKRVVLIAGGPSLDKNIHLLREKPQDVVYIAVGTVFRKLLSLGIPIDYVIITDPKKAVYSQVRGLESQQVPMLLLSTAYGEISRVYEGKKYLICQKDFEEAERFARLHNYHLYNTGGSVITTALDVVIAQGVAAIIFVGLDLAFTDNKDHASDAVNGERILAEGRLTVPSVEGGVVTTIRPLYMYKKWIERRIREADVTMPVYDATEGGAVIEGMKLVKLREVLPYESRD